jgi:hypothetical protein
MKFPDVIKNIQPRGILHIQTHDLPVQDKKFGQQLHLHKTVQNKHVEYLGIVGYGHDPVGPRPGFKCIGN